MTPQTPGTTAFLGSEGPDHEDVRRGGLWAGAAGPDQVPAVGWTQRPRDLELAEAEERRDLPEAIARRS